MSLRSVGRTAAARAYNTLAATALANDLPIYTCNPDDFQGIEGLRVNPIPHPDVWPADAPPTPTTSAQ